MVRTGLIIGLATTIGLVTIGHLAGLEVAGERASAPSATHAAAPEPLAETLAAPAPVIAAVDVATVASSRQPGAKDAAAKAFKLNHAEQVFAVKGQGFEEGLTATLVAPLGLTTTFPAAAIADLKSTSFTIRLMFDEPGAFLFSVRNQDGARSASHQIVVKR